MWESVADGLQAVAEHAAQPLLDALLSWRRDAVSRAQLAADSGLVIRKRVTSRAKRLARKHSIDVHGLGFPEYQLLGQLWASE